MGRVILDSVVQQLRTQGIRADYAYLAGEMVRVSGVVVAVSLEALDREKGITTVLVEVIAPKESGGRICQTKAEEVCEILSGIGAICQQKKCTFLPKMNAFCVPVFAQFRDISQYSVTIGTMSLQYVCGFSAEQTLEETATAENAQWKITLEEFFPWGISNTVEQEESFDLDIHGFAEVERYYSCRWVQRKRIIETLGVREIRIGIAQSRSFISD